MSEYEYTKSVEVDGERYGRPEKLTIAVNKAGNIFGLVFDLNFKKLSLYSYRVDENFTPGEAVELARKRGGFWTFHGGARIRCSADELYRAFIELGMI